MKPLKKVPDARRTQATEEAYVYWYAAQRSAASNTADGPFSEISFNKKPRLF